MSLFSRIAGVVTSFFQIGGPSGSGWNDNAGALEGKNSTNSAFVNVRGADPAGLNDFVTLESLSNFAASPVKTLGRFEYWGGTTNGATLIEGMCNCTLDQSGSVVATGPSAGSLLTSTKSMKFRNAIGSGATTNGVFDGTGFLTVWRGNAAGLGGFNMRLKFGFEAAPANTLVRMLAGLIAQSGVGAAQDWTTQLTIASIGVGFTQTPAAPGVFAGNWQLIHSTGNGATPPTVLDLGPTMALDTTSLWQLDLTAVPNGASINVVLTNLSTGASVTQVVNANFPANNAFLAMWCAYAVGNGATTIGQIDIAEYAYQQNN
jgi:hypothetical protein